MKRISKQEFLSKYNYIISEEQLNNLQFDYFSHNYPKGKLLPLEDVKYLYMDLNLTRLETAQCMGVSPCKVFKAVKHYNLNKPTEQILRAKERRCLEKYGVSNIGKVPEFTQKAKQTCLEKYGYTCYAKTEEFKQKSINTNRQRYGVDNYAQTKECREKMEQTCLERYGNKTFLATEQGKQKSKITCLQKYGKEHYVQTKEYKERYKNTCLEKYGVENASQDKQIQAKIRQTMKKNNTFRKMSKAETYMFEKLQQKFKHIEYEHWEQRYPFKCDFYIPELDLFIEAQIYQGHGNHIFNPQNPEDIQQLEHWQQKCLTNPKSQYKDYIKTWTIRDPLKRKTARENNLNWIEFFNLKQFDNWFESL